MISVERYVVPCADLKLTTLRSSGSPPETCIFWTCFTKLLYALSVLYYYQLMFWITQHASGEVELGTLGVMSYGKAQGNEAMSGSSPSRCTTTPNVLM